jgi:hypothetical protein
MAAFIYYAFFDLLRLLGASLGGDTLDGSLYLLRLF